MTAYRVTVGKEALFFAAAHFITFGRDGCEPLHGHNYRVGVRLRGEPGPDSMVYDFVALKRDMESLLDELDHRVLLPTSNPMLEIEVGSGHVEVRHPTRSYRFPESDVVLLPVPNTTAERLAEHLGHRLRARLGAAGDGIHEIEVEVEEAPGQSATWTDDFSA
jgi:6-pyruvoyltetrahydropterin/6-carboxytetrahydropterin synthase